MLLRTSKKASSLLQGNRWIRHIVLNPEKNGFFPITCQSQKISPWLKSGPGTYTGASSGYVFCIDALRTCSWVQQWWNLPQGSPKYTYPQFFCFILWQCLVPTSAAKYMHVRTFEDCPWNHCVSDFSEQSKFICVWIKTRTYFLFWLVWNMNFIFHHIWDVIPTPLTLTPSFFKMGIAPPTKSPHDLHQLKTIWMYPLVI